MSETTTIRVKRALYNTLKSIAKEKNRNMQDILEQAVKDYKKKAFFDNLHEAYARLKDDPKAMAEAAAEIAEWDATLLDGLEDDGDGK